ncbi:hypothetical protein ACVXZY_16630 [Staphylococcus aureus]
MLVQSYSGTLLGVTYKAEAATVHVAVVFGAMVLENITYGYL